jgi:hypothetical protein
VKFRPKLQLGLGEKDGEFLQWDILSHGVKYWPWRLRFFDAGGGVVKSTVTRLFLEGDCGVLANDVKSGGDDPSLALLWYDDEVSGEGECPGKGAFLLDKGPGATFRCGGKVAGIKSGTNLVRGAGMKIGPEPGISVPWRGMKGALLDL